MLQKMDFTLAFFLLSSRRRRRAASLLLEISRELERDDGGGLRRHPVRPLDVSEGRTDRADEGDASEEERPRSPVPRDLVET